METSEDTIRRAQYLRAVLAWHGHTQSDLGRLIGCSQVAAGRKLRAQRRFTVEELLVIADAYGLEPGHLLRPPELEPVLGLVRSSEGHLLTCTFNALRLVSRGGLTPCDIPANSGLFASPRAA